MDNFCKYCGSELDENGKCLNKDCPSNTEKKDEFEKKENKIFNSTFNGSFGFETPKESFKKNLLSYKQNMMAESGKLIVPECINPDENEVSIKQYDVVRLQTLLSGAFAEGRLQITNKRVIFRAHGASLNGSTVIQNEFSIDEVGGIEFRKEPCFNFLVAVILLVIFFVCRKSMNPTFLDSLYDNTIIVSIISLLFAGASIIAFIAFKNIPIVSYFIVMILINLLEKSSFLPLTMVVQASKIIMYIVFMIVLFQNIFARNVVIRILTKGAGPAVEIRRKDGFFSAQRNEYTGFSQVTAGPDIDEAIQEVGSVIRAVQLGQIK